MSFRKLSFSVVAAMAMMATKAPAAVTVYTNKTAFLAAINSNYYQEGFESTTIGPTSFNFSGGTGTTYKYTATSTSAAGGFYPFVPTGGSSQALATSNSNQPITFTVNAGSAPVTAFGGYFFDTNVSGSLAGTLPEVTTNLSAGYTTLSSATFTSFIGFTSNTPFTSLTVGELPASNNFPSIDNFIVGTANPVPEPASIAVLGVPAAMALLRRRRTAI
jgi:hypothetical protein